MDIAVYINDARALKMILLGGVTGRELADYMIGNLSFARWDGFNTTIS